ncbi:MAG: hypothetical protein ISR69_15370 [Gammaproteobacteria bacterium]|nr:hypothetical protein [Gammaproteobacteria bacterium]
MDNTVTVSAEFFFKGVKLTPSLVLDCDLYLTREAKLPPLYPLLARANNMDLYSYEYEILQAEQLHFSQAQGLIAKFVHEEVLDEQGFVEAWILQKVDEHLQEIATNHLQIENIKTHPELYQAMYSAFQYGLKQRK